MPEISMHPSARYVTQSGIFDNMRLGRLTDSKIEKYRKLGYYSNGFKEERKDVQKKKKSKRDNKSKSKNIIALDALNQLLGIL